jgi:hypothetical protein
MFARARKRELVGGFECGVLGDRHVRFDAGPFPVRLGNRIDGFRNGACRVQWRAALRRSMAHPAGALDGLQLMSLMRSVAS